MIHTALHGDVTVLTIHAREIDAESAPDLRTAVGSCLAGAEKVVLDLGQVKFMDSTGIGAVLACIRQANAGAGALRLCNIGRAVRSAFEMVRLDRIVEIHPTRDEALSAFTLPCNV